MPRISMSLIFATMIFLTGAFPALSQPALENGLPMELLILRVEGDSFWIELTEESGEPAAIEIVQRQAGVAQVEMNPLAEEAYQKHQVQDVYIYRNELQPFTYDPTSTLVEIRIFTFPDENHAAAYLAEAYDSQVSSTAEAELDPQLAQIDPLPAFETPLVGWTSVMEYSDVQTLEFSGLASSVRYMTQVGRAIVSAQVVGPFVDFNFDLALGLLELQADCLNRDAICPAVSFGLATDAWQPHGDGVLYFPTGVSDLIPARWMFPVTEPVRAPEISESLGG